MWIVTDGLGMLVPTALLMLGGTPSTLDGLDTNTSSGSIGQRVSSTACVAGDKLALYPIAPPSIKESKGGEMTRITKRFYVFSHSGCSFRISGIAPTGFPYMRLTSGLTAKLNINEPTPSVVELVSEVPVPARALETFCDRVPLHRWRRGYATVVPCDQGNTIPGIKIST